ncbi:MAG TPA: alpha-amylase family glycosyl hydrolase, partial [Bacteroidales bacterium]|nr:alpha-amylase family glycosyl hydrolase [Bacteroidales bacterium]
MEIPDSTYRLQFTPSFKFSDAEKIVPYLTEMGISAIYASPVFKARKGSQHGYDITDPNVINPELGSED